jgi:hypothetical protein
MGEDWSIRRYREGDENQINSLFNVVFQAARPLQEWRWKFLDNPCMTKLSSSALITVTESNGTIVGQYASLPLIFKMRDSAVRVAQPVDSMVHSDYRKGARGILELFALQYDRAREDGIQFGFGFPNERHHPVGKRLLRYQDLSRLPTLFKRLNWRLGIKRKLPISSPGLLSTVQKASGKGYRISLALKEHPEDVQMLQVKAFDERIDDLWTRAKGRYEIMAVRDRRFLNWRYVEKPDDPYNILLAEQAGKALGYIILKITHASEACVGVIVDLLSTTRAIDEALINAALHHFLDEKVDFALGRVLREDALYLTLRQYGFTERKEFPSIPVVYMVFSEGVDEHFLKNPYHWHLTYGDQLDATL